MPALNFNTQFALAVETGTKSQTIRAHRKDGRPHCKVGDTIKLYTGMRTKSCRVLRTARVTRIDTITINAIDMQLNGRQIFSNLDSRDADLTDNEFAKNDGFNSFTDMAAWFERTHGLPFSGVVIYWE